MLNIMSRLGYVGLGFVLLGGIVLLTGMLNIALLLAGIGATLFAYRNHDAQTLGILRQNAGQALRARVRLPLADWLLWVVGIVLMGLSAVVS
jgi:hypothetical protein